jgi:hypothetical protein
MNLFQKKTFKAHSGGIKHFKIECDALTNGDIETLAYIISRKVSFYDVFGIPTGGIIIANALEKYKDRRAHRYLIVDE